MTANSNHTAHYEITVKGHLEKQWSEWFNGMDIRNLPSGETVINGLVVDQAALHGIFTKIRDLGLPLISVNRIQLDLEESR